MNIFNISDKYVQTDLLEECIILVYFMESLAKEIT